MVLHAEVIAPHRFATGSGFVVAAFRRHDAGIAFSQLLKAGIAVTLVETFVAVAAAIDAGDFARVSQADLLVEQGIEGYRFCTERQQITHW
jgi:hypothetical protein